MQSMNPVEKKEVKQKSLKALEKLGHKSLVLDEYESACVRDSVVARTDRARCMQGR